MENLMENLIAKSMLICHTIEKKSKKRKSMKKAVIKSIDLVNQNFKINSSPVLRELETLRQS